MCDGSSTQRAPLSLASPLLNSCRTHDADDFCNRTAHSRTSAARRFPLRRPSIGAEEIAEVVATLESGWLSTGPRVAEFEAAFAEYAGARFAVAVNSCTAALHLSLLAAGAGLGDEVITTPLTFCATANAIVHAGATPIFADIDPLTWNLDPAAASQAMTPRTRAILPVHYAGRPADMRAFRAAGARCRRGAD